MPRITDILHFVLGVLAGATELATPVTVLYAVYQAVERERWREKKKDFIVYGAGLVTGYLLRLTLLEGHRCLEQFYHELEVLD